MEVGTKPRALKRLSIGRNHWHYRTTVSKTFGRERLDHPRWMAGHVVQSLWLTCGRPYWGPAVENAQEKGLLTLSLLALENIDQRWHQNMSTHSQMHRVTHNSGSRIGVDPSVI